MRTTRANSEPRQIKIIKNFTPHAEGSVLYCSGNTQVLCNISIEEGVPRFLKDEQTGWLTAEYSLLPRSTHTRCQREAARGKQSGRTLEIQRLIGRSLRAMVDLKKIPGYTITADCDVLTADGGTRTAAINGAACALILALQNMQYTKAIKQDPIRHLIGAISIGVKNDEVLVDLDYEEDSQIDTDLNIVLTESHQCIEIQGTAEGLPLELKTMSRAIEQSKAAVDQIIHAIKQTLNE
ncbi:ribonuclease PH [Gammaproteobacteria bacterium]|nr:ribonuclease PH [Gammaproteobacteria bacterium]